MEAELIFVTPLDKDRTTPFPSVVLPGVDPGKQVKFVAGIGEPFYVFSGQGENIGFDYANLGMGTDWEGAIICSEDDNANLQAIISMLEKPPVGKIWPA